MRHAEYHTLMLDALPGLKVAAPARLMKGLESPTPECVPFDITEVLPLIDDFFHRHAKSEGDKVYSITSDSLPDLAIPYKETWWEWSDVLRSRQSFIAGRSVLGCHVRVFDSEQIIGLIKAEPGKNATDDVRLIEMFGRGKMTLEMNLYGGPSRERLRPGETVALLQRACAILGTDGRIKMQIFNAGEGLCVSDDLPKRDRGLSGLFAGVLFAIALLGSHNTEQEEVEPPLALSKKRVRRGGLPLVRYHRLRVRVPGRGPKRYVDTDAIRGAQGESVPLGLHWVRGHFKTYTADRPLMGRAVGRWYWPPHLAGDVTAGVIGKTYVETPAPPEQIVEEI